MRITLVQGAFHPVPPLRGTSVEKLHYCLAREFARHGCEVTHISRTYPGLPAEETVDGVRYRRIGGFDPPTSLVKLKALDLIYSLRVLGALPPADVVMTNTFWLPMLLHRGPAGIVYVNVHRYPRGQMRYYARAQRLQAVSTVVADAIIEQTPAVRGLVKMIPNQLPEGWAEPMPDLAAEREREILFVGRVHPEKGVGLLLDAFARASAAPAAAGWRLAVVGPAEAASGGAGTDYLESLRRKAASAGIAERVEWVGPIYDGAELKRRYDRAALFVYPSVAAVGEASPLAPLEAMARGCPPVVSDLACFRDYLTPGESGFVFDHRGGEAAAAERLGETLARLIASPDALASARAAAARTAQGYTVERLAQVYLDDFDQLLGRPPSDRAAAAAGAGAAERQDAPTPAALSR